MLDERVSQDALASLVAEEVGVPKKTALAMILSLKKNVKVLLQENKKIVLVDFGTFHTQELAAREGRNPKTGEKILIKKRKKVVFKPGKELKDAVQV